MNDAAGDPVEAEDPATRSANDLLIVGIGGSAGSIPSLQAFFREVPDSSGIAYVVILHLSSEHESHLAAILQAVTRIPVAQVEKSTRIEPDRIYVIPPSRSLSLSAATLELGESAASRRAPIDLFFRSLAETQASRAVSVVLSGTGSDGSSGIKRIKEYNGLVLAQDPAEAEFDEMPRNAIATGVVDQVLPVAAMPGKIIAYRDQIDQIRIEIPEGDEGKGDEKALADVFASVRLRTGHDFSSYKRGTLLRRLERRMAVHELATLPEYAAFLRGHPDEPLALLNDLLISVTNFFRDAPAFEQLQALVLPSLFEGRGPHDQLRVWVPACATGEEAYSLAMLLVEAAERIAFPPSIQIFATDLDEAAIARARDASYTAAAMADVPPERIRRFFVKENEDRYRVRRELRELVLFARHNAIKDPPFSHLQLVSCRNLLIYLNRSAQERVMEVLHFALDPGGFLFLGAAESIETSGHLFAAVNKEGRIYQRRPGPAGPVRAPHLAIELAATPSLPREGLPSAVRSRMLPLELHLRLLEHYAPPSLIVDENHTVLHLTPRAGQYLEFQGGDASLDLLRIVRPDLRLELRTALHQASEKGVPVETRPLDSGERETIRIVVTPVPADLDGGRTVFLVVFRPADAPPDARTPGGAEITAAGPAAPQLEEEIVRLKAQMRATIEQYETHAEELRAANEELQAMNEELRSATEELETGKEELQSVNEELHTVNQELKGKIDELSRANDDMRNLMSATGIGTIFVDRALAVKLFTRTATDIFNLIPSDAGRPLADITNRLVDDSALQEDIEKVLDQLRSTEREVATRDGRWHLMRLVPYRTADDRIDGVVLTFMDITTRKLAEEALEHAREQLERRVEERTTELKRQGALLEAALAEKANLLRRIVEAQEHERHRISRELHDEMGQHLAVLKIGLETAAKGDARSAIPRLREVLAEIDKSVDRLSLELRPAALDELGLEGAVRGLIDRFSDASGIVVDFDTSGLGRDRLPPQIEITLYRVLQEALTNVWKHANAHSASVVLARRSESVQMIIEDDGTGIAPDAPDDRQPHLGILGIRERVELAGGTVSIESAVGKGTSLYVRIPSPGDKTA